MSIFGVVLFIWFLWFLIPRLFRGSAWVLNSRGVQSVAAKTPGYWECRKWLSRPLLGYRRQQVVLLALITAAMAAHLTWYSQVLSPAPKLRLAGVNNALKTNWPQLTRLPRVYWSATRKPVEGDVSDLPFPVLRMSFTTPHYADGPPAKSEIDKILERNREYYPRQVNQIRGLSCSYSVTGEQECLLEATVPVIHEFGVYKDEKARGPLARIRLRDFTLALLSTDEKLAATWRFQRRTGSSIKDMARNYGNALKIRFPVAGPEIVNSNSWQPTELQPFLAIASGQEALAVEITTDPYHVEAAAKKDCTRLQNDKSKTLTSYCISILENELVHMTSRCRRDSETGAWLCPWSSRSSLKTAKSILVGDTDTHSTIYEINSDKDRAFLAMFLNISGFDTAPVKLTPELMQLREQIIRDYRIVLGLDEERGQDTNAISSALSRQPQLFAYYRHRDFWAERVMVDLERKFIRMCGQSPAIQSGVNFPC